MVWAVSAHFAVAYVTGTRFYVDLASYAAGSERLPFQYRALTSWLLHGIASLPPLRALAASLPPPFAEIELLALAAITLASAAAAIDLTRRSLALFMNEGMARALAFLLPLSMYFSYVALASSYRFSYPYDVPSLALLALCIFAMLGGRWALLYVGFALASLNRETSLFLIPLLLLYRWPVDRAGFAAKRVRLLGHALALLAIWLAIKYALARLYAGNPVEGGGSMSGAFVWQAGQNLRNLLDPIYWPSLSGVLGYLWVIILLGWKYLGDTPLRRGLWVVPLWAAGMLMVGRITELRIFGELGAYMAVVAGVAIHNFLRARGYRPAR
jgi:hypothetical protein